MSKPILLIDDEERFALMLQELLQINGYEADYCLNPKEALVRLRQENYTLVITDYKMPEMDGAQFLEAARRFNPDLPVIMISGLMNMPELIKVANIGVTLVLEKPFKTEELLEHVARFVHPVEGGEASALAMDMEASEISFLQQSVPVSYPSPATHLSDASNENKRFLEALWKSANSCRHLPFFAQRGAEVRLVAMEVMGWTEHEAGAEIVRIELADTATEITRGWVMESERFPGALLVDLRGCEWNGETRARLVDWVKFVESSGKDLSLSRLLYVLPTGARFTVDELGLPGGLSSLFAVECPVLLSLRERVLDTATYLHRLLDAGERRALGRDGLVRLLHYSWPGGFQELQERLQAVRARLAKGDVPDGAQLGALLADGSEDPASLKCGLDMTGYLKRRQREYILLHREPGEELRDTVLRLGIDSDSVSADDVLTDRELAFPGIIRAAS